MKNLSDKIHNLERLLSPASAYIYSILAALASSTAFYLVKQLKGFTTAEIIYYRSFSHVIYSYFFMTANNMQFHFNDVKISRLLFFRGVLGGIGIFCNFAGFIFLPLSEATVITQTSPVFIGILSVFILKAKYDVIQLIIAVQCIIGVIFIAKPSFLFSDSVEYRENRSLGIVAAITGSFITALVQIYIKKIGVKTNTGIVAFYFGFFCTLCSGMWMSILGSKATFTFKDVIYFAIIGFLMFSNNILINRSLILGIPARVSLMGYISIIYTYVLDVVFLGIDFDKMSIIGILCIFSCVFILFYQSIRQN